VLIAASTWQLTQLTADFEFWELLLPQIFRGAALMMCMIPSNIMALGTLPPQRIKNAAGLYNLMRNIGGAFGLAGINTLMSDRLNLHWARLAEHTSMARPEIQAWIDNMSTRMGDRLPGDAELLAVKRLGDLVMREAMVLSFADVFWLMSVLFALMLLAMPLVKRPPMMAFGGH
jgi:DHA2 family multidrug resistance protein